MNDYRKYINALRKCAKEHENDGTSTGHIIVSDLCRDTANLLEIIESGSWISVGERLPEKSGEYLVSLIDPNDDEYKCVGIAWYAHPREYNIVTGEWREKMIGEEVIAWKPLPRPYRLADEG